MSVAVKSDTVMEDPKIEHVPDTVDGDDDTTDAVDAVEAPDAVDATDAVDALDAVDAIDAVDTPDAVDAPETDKSVMSDNKELDSNITLAQNSFENQITDIQVQNEDKKEELIDIVEDDESCESDDSSENVKIVQELLVREQLAEQKENKLTSSHVDDTRALSEKDNSLNPSVAETANTVTPEAATQHANVTKWENTKEDIENVKVKAEDINKKHNTGSKPEEKEEILISNSAPASKPPLTQPESDNVQQQNQTNQSSSNSTKNIDLQKIFTPATDAKEINPKNRKLYASSAFYSPSLHPTVEDQLELARRISHSLSDISNQQSKGQSMFVNRKKRSVKWVHESLGKDSTTHDYEYEEESKSNNNTYFSNGGTGLLLHKKLPLKLIMHPRGQIQDIYSVRGTLNIATGLLSPDNCAKVVNALNAQKGRGAELFAKRRRKANEWVIDESNAGTQSPSGLPDYHYQQSKPSSSPTILQAYSDAGKHRALINMQQEQLLEKYASPSVKVVKTPWNAALETGSASTAFQDGNNYTSYSNQQSIVPALEVQKINDCQQQPYKAYQQTNTTSYNNQRELAYKPNIAQGWKVPNLKFPKELYVPKEIPLESYAPPPTTSTSIFSKVKNDNKNWSATRITNTRPDSTFSQYGCDQQFSTKPYFLSASGQQQSSPYRSKVIESESKERNISPHDAKRMTSSISHPHLYTDRTSLSHYKTQGLSNFPTTQLSNYNTSAMASPSITHTVDLSHCKNFNNAALGWGISGKNDTCDVFSRNFYVRPVAFTESIPYTDF